MGLVIQKLCSNNSGKYIFMDFKQFCTDYNIEQQISIQYTPWQYRVK